MKYTQQVQLLQPVWQNSENILIALGANPNIDELAAALAFYLSAEEAGKQVSIVTEGVIRVGHTNLYGVGEVQNNLPQALNGNLTIVLGGVVDKDQQKPTTLQELKWHPEGPDLHLVFHPLPGKKFEPTHITPTYEGGHFDAIILVGATKLDDLGHIYTTNKDIFTHPNTKLVNIDNKKNNTNFASINIVDLQTSTISEMIVNLLKDLKLPFSQDIASNTLTGMFASTHNLQDDNINPDTYLTVADALRAGGKKPKGEVFETPSSQEPIVSKVEKLENKAGFDLNAPKNTSMSFDDQPLTADYTQPQEKQPQDVQGSSSNEPISSPEEVPSGEAAATPGSDWLTPKIYRGGSIG